MPNMDGPSAIRELRRMNPNIKVIAMSGMMTPEQTARLDELKIQGSISKPFTAEALLRAISHALHGPR